MAPPPNSSSFSEAAALTSVMQTLNNFGQVSPDKSYLQVLPMYSFLCPLGASDTADGVVDENSHMRILEIRQS